MAKRRSFGKITKVPRKSFQGGFGYEASFANPRFGYDGEPRRVVRIFKLATVARKWLAQQEAAIEQETWQSPKQAKAERELEMLGSRNARTFGEYVADWSAKRNHTPSVRRTNESLLRIHLLPKWGEVSLRDITPEDVDNWAMLELAPGFPGARRHAYDLFSAIMNNAEALQVIPRSPCTRVTDANVAKSIASQKSLRHESRSLTDVEIAALMTELPGSMVPMFSFMLMTGLRIGEARELRWKDTDLSTGECSITRSVTGTGKNLAVREGTKTKASDRVINLGPHSLKILRDLLETRGKPAPDDLIFHSVRDPSKHYSESLFNNNLHAACKRLGIPHASAHDLRHSWADRGGRNAESIRDVQESLGHATPSMSLHYMKSSNEARRVLQAAVEDQFTVAIKGALS